LKGKRDLRNAYFQRPITIYTGLYKKPDTKFLAKKLLARKMFLHHVKYLTEAGGHILRTVQKGFKIVSSSLCGNEWLWMAGTKRKSNIAIFWGDAPCTLVGLPGYTVLHRRRQPSSYSNGCLLGCSAVQSGGSLPTFQRSLLPPSSGRWVINTMLVIFFRLSCRKTCSSYPRRRGPQQNSSRGLKEWPTK
jgi:hypothetical protein